MVSSVVGSLVIMLASCWCQLLWCGVTASLVLPGQTYQPRLRPPYTFSRTNRCNKITVPNGVMVLKHRGRVAKFTCNSGYKLIGDRIATCHYRTWDTVPTCVKDVICPSELPIVLNGHMVEHDYVYYKVVCNAGYKLPEGSPDRYPCEIFYQPEMKPPVCQLTDAHFCDFEKDWCGWNNSIPYFSWIRYQNATPSHELHTGPSGDHTNGTGHYLYIEASGLPDNEERYAKLTRRFLKIDSPEVCFSFWYHMYGFNIGTLDVYVDHLKVFSKSGNLGEQWRKGIVQKLPSDRDFYISLVATTSNGFAGDIAIDDIGLINSTECTKQLLIETTCKGRCYEEETNDTLCKCSSECLIESTCCADFTQLCSGEEVTTTDSVGLTGLSEDSSSSVLYYSTTENIQYEFRTTDESRSSTVGNTGEVENQNQFTGETWSSPESYTTDSITQTQQLDDNRATAHFTDVKLETIEERFVHTTSIDYASQSNTMHYTARNPENGPTYPIPYTTISSSETTLFSASTWKDSIPSSAKHATSSPNAIPTSKQATKLLITTPVLSHSVGFVLRNATTKLKTTASPKTTPKKLETRKLTTKPTRTTSIPSHSIGLVLGNSMTKTPSRSTEKPTKSIVTTKPPVFVHSNVFELSHTSTLTKSPVTSSVPPPSRGLFFENPTSKRPNSTTISPTKRPAPIITIKAPNNELVLGNSPTRVTPQPHTTISPSNPTTDLVKPTSSDLSASNHPWDDQDDYVFDVFSTSAPTTVGALVKRATSVPPYFRAHSGAEQWKKTFVPKGRYTFSAVKADSRTTTYVSIVGCLGFLLVAALGGYLIRYNERRRLISRFDDSTAESDVLYMSNEEMLDFNVARRQLTPCDEPPHNSVWVSQFFQTKNLLD